MPVSWRDSRDYAHSGCFARLKCEVFLPSLGIKVSRDTRVLVIKISAFGVPMPMYVEAMIMVKGHQVSIRASVLERIC